MRLLVKFEPNANLGKYVCIVKEINGGGDKTKVFRVTGKHVKGKTNIDVQCIMFLKKDLKGVPQNLKHFFPNLDMLMMRECGIETLKKDDLKELSQLKVLFCDGNFIKSLPDDVFDETPLLEMVSFQRNKIEHIGPKTFSSLKLLQLADLMLNVNFDRIMLFNEFKRLKFKDGGN